MTGLSDSEWAPLDDWSVVMAAGPDAAAFLQSFCTNDLLGLNEGTSCEAFFTDVKAKIIAFTWVGKTKGGYAVLLSSSRAQELADHLDRYLIRENVVLSVTNTGVVLAGSPLSESRESAQFGLACFGESATAYFGPGETTDFLGRRLRESRGEPLSSDVFERLRIGLGVPKDAVDVDRRNLPQEVDRNERAISFTKGCYLGQEPVARIDALGQVNWLLRGLEIVGGESPARETEVTSEGQAVGRVTPAIGAGGSVRALAYLRRAKSNRGEVLAIEGRRAVVVDWPST